MEVPHQSHAFKGIHYIPVSKTEAFYGIVQALHTRNPSLSFMVFFSFNLSCFQVNHHRGLMGFRNGLLRGSRTGSGHGMTPLSAASRLWLGPSSPLNNFSGEPWFWHRVPLFLLSHAQMYRGLWLSERWDRGNMVRVWSAPSCDVSDRTFLVRL